MIMRTAPTKTVIALTATAIGVALTLTGCATPPEESGSTGSTAPNFTACAVSGAGGWNDRSFNEQVLDGLEQAEKDLGVAIVAFESKTSDDFAPGLASLIDQNCDVIFSVGFEANDAVNAAAAANPDVRFVTVDGYVKDEKTTNLKAVTYSMSQSAFLGGYVAAAHSSTHIIGAYGAVQNSAITDFLTGYYNGAQQWAADNDTPTQVLGWDPATETGVFVGDFTNQVTAKSISAAQLDQGADVLFPVAGPLFAATAEAIKDSGKDAVFLGVDSDVAVTSPDYADLTLVSVEKRTTSAVTEIIAQAVEGEFTAEAYVGTLDNDGTGLSDFHSFASFLTPELQSTLDELTVGIVDGSIITLD